MAFYTFSSFFNRIGHYWMLCSKNSDQLAVLNRLTDIFAVGKFDYGVMVRCKWAMRVVVNGKISAFLLQAGKSLNKKKYKF